MPAASGEVTADDAGEGIAIITLRRPPANHLDARLVSEIADAYEELARSDARVVVLCAEGKHFCAGVKFVPGADGPAGSGLYRQVVRLFTGELPVVAAVQGAAIGGGLGLALSADFRVVGSGSRLAANFSRLGLHHGFGISVTLPAVVGNQRALELLYTGREVRGAEAIEIGLADRLAPDEDIHAAAHAFAAEIAAAAPLAVRAIRRTMRGHLAEAVRNATEIEDRAQQQMIPTADFAEGIRASSERRSPVFTGR
jgi:2-(1,2-epoxy-1,2-dihydrophenyl)acetyl-CoA isomerase